MGLLLIGLIIYGKKDDWALNRIGERVVASVFKEGELEQDEIYSRTGLLLDLEREQIVYRKNINEKIYPASLTKIMTSLVALENIDSLDQRVRISREDFKGVDESGAALAGFREGEELTKRDLLYGLMLASGAEAANALANSLGGEEAFVDLMNRKAEELGMKKTHFTNPTGLHHKDHYTTAGDLAILLSQALDNGDFRALVTREAYVTEATGLKITSRVFDKLEEDKMEGYRILGGKTGYTRKAGLCLASICEKEGREYLLITAGAPGGPEGLQYNFLDAYRIYDRYL